MICLAAMLVMTACGKKDAAGAAAPSVTEQPTETTQEETASSTETTKPTETTEATKSTEETKPTETEPTKETEPSKATDKSKASEPSKATDKSKAVEPTKTTDKSKATEPSKAADNAGTKPSTPASTQANETKESQAPAPTPAPTPTPAPEPAPAPVPAPHTHSMTTESVAATCGTAGHTKVYCTTCGYVESESTIPATGQHSYGPEIATGGSNCQDPKNAYQVCTVCGSKNGTAWNEPGPHVGATTTTKEPSCTEGGTWEEKCSLCGAMLGGGSIEPLDCVDSNGDRICDTCGRVL